jgi:O-antigen ligase
VIVCGGVALLQVAMSLAARYLQRSALLSPGRRMTVLRALALLAVLGVVGIAADAPDWANHRWREFKAPAGTVKAYSQDDIVSRLQGANGNSRFQYWQSALDASTAHPWTGIGPGTFEFWWARHGTAPAFIRDAHTLYFETLAETGFVGFALLVGLLLWLGGAAILRSLRAAPAVRVWIAASAGGLAAFMTAAALEWVWEMAAITVVALALGAVIVAGRDEASVAAAGDKARSATASRAALVLLAVVALAAVAVPMAGALATDRSRDAAADGRLTAALEDSRTAERLQPYAATPQLQRALVLEAAGALDAAAGATRSATADEPTNWRMWLVLARIDARRGSSASALHALREARRLNPRSALFVR